MVTTLFKKMKTKNYSLCLLIYAAFQYPISTSADVQCLTGNTPNSPKREELLHCFANCLGLTKTSGAANVTSPGFNTSCVYNVVSGEGEKMFDWMSFKPCKSRQCLPPSECISNTTVLHPNGTVNWKNVGLKIPATFKTICYSDYLFSSSVDTFLKAQKFCCSIGMKLASFEHLLDMRCMQFAVKKDGTATGTYWVAATSEGCGRRFWSCNLDKAFSEKAAWTKDIPDPQGPLQCVLLDVTLYRTRLTVGNCSKPERFICEPANKYTEADEDPSCTIATCTKMDCTPKPTAFPKTAILKLPPDFEQLTSGCGFHYARRMSGGLPFAEARETCCKLNMTLLTVPTEERKMCIKKLNITATLMVWTGGSDLGCRFVHTWCDSGELFAKKSPWIGSDPNHGVEERCIGFFHHSIPELGLYDVYCSNPNDVICEIPILEDVTIKSVG